MISDLVERFHPNWVVAMSWGKDSVAVAGLVREVYPDLPIRFMFTDTGRKPDETYEHMKAVQGFFSPVETDYYRPDRPIETCEDCKAWKAEAAKLAPVSYKVEAMLVGIRRDEHSALADLPVSEEYNGVLRYYPILEWSEDDVWNYTRDRGLPVHPLYAEGYRSIGCRAPCSVKVPPGGTERGGRDPEREKMRHILRGAGYW